MSIRDEEYTVESLNREIERLSGMLSRCNDPDDIVYYEKEIKSVEKIKFLIEKECVVTEYGPGLILINSRFVLAYRGHKWRINGKARWYDYRSIETFYTNNIERSALSMTPSKMANVIEGFKLTCEYDKYQHKWKVCNYKFEGEGDQLKEAVVNFLYNLDEGNKKQKLQEIEEYESE